jgi:two-component system sensor histidine kinase RpfC
MTEANAPKQPLLSPRLPAPTVSGDGDQTAAEPAPEPGAPRVLVAEDNAIAATVIRTLLAQQGVAVTLVADGEAALEAARRADFDLAFIDLRMPKIDGIDFTERVRGSEENGRRLPIIALTANAAEDIKDRCLAAGMDAFLTKPVDAEALRTAVTKYTPKRRD